LPTFYAFLTVNRWHQDLKPDNILVVVGDRKPNYKGLSFKIADFELSHFKTIMEGDAEPTTLGRWGTRTYGT
jgi:serine/threonine protein kinase